MSKFSSKPARANITATLATVERRAYTEEGHLGYERDAKSALFLLAVSNMVGEDTFYEGAGERDQRFRALVHQVVSEDPAWVAAFVPYLRDTMQMRSASIVMACEYLAAGGTNGRQVINAAIVRADEPAEALAYWAQRYGRNFPQPLKRGVADAVRRLYTERNALRYDGNSRAWRMGDVIDVVHPKPVAIWQSNLFRWLLDVRHNRMEITLPADCPVIAARNAMEAIPVPARRECLAPAELAAAGMSWESLSGWLQGPMDAQAWEAVIPSMGYMALLRNLRNFEQANVSPAVLADVALRLADPEQVAKSRQFPIRFLSAYKNIASERFAFPLEQALDLATANIPHLSGRTLVMIDVSGSMRDTMSGRSELQRWEVAAVFGLALAKRCEQVDVVAYQSQAWRIDTNGSVLRLANGIRQMVGGGTDTFGTLQAAYAGHDRVVILTDEQSHRGPSTALTCPLYTFNLAGYSTAQTEQGSNGSYVFGGLTDAGFRMIAALEDHRRVAWPFA